MHVLKTASWCVWLWDTTIQYTDAIRPRWPSLLRLCRARYACRPTRSDAGGYRLSFSDWLVQHEATESRPFEADK
jgi:hypothetical protein